MKSTDVLPPFWLRIVIYIYDMYVYMYIHMCVYVYTHNVVYMYIHTMFCKFVKFILK